MLAGRRGEKVSCGNAHEAALIARIDARDVAAFEELYRLFHPRLVRFLLTIMHRPTIVEEALNDTMMVVWNKAGSYRGASRVSTWIFAIAYRQALKALRRQDLPVEDRDADTRISDAQGPEQALGLTQANHRLLAAMASLSPDHRAVIDLTYFHGLGTRDIAEVMGCPVDTVKTRMFHARRKLRGHLPGNAADWLWDD